MSRDISWQKSSFSGGGDGNNCLELATAPSGPVLRESDEPTVVITTTPARLVALLFTIKGSDTPLGG